MLTGKITAIIIAIVLATSTTVAVLVTIIAIVLQPWDVVRVRPTSTPVETGTPAATSDADTAATPVITQTPNMTMTVTPEIAATPDITTTVVYSGKVTICHIPPGNPNAVHNITISRSAVKTHLGHGDTVTVGPCVDPSLIIDVIVLTGTVDYEAGIAIDLDGILVPGYRGGGGGDDDGDDDHGGGGCCRGDHDRGHGNDSDHHDEDNPGRSGHK